MDNLISTLGGDLLCQAGVTYTGSSRGGKVDKAAKECAEELNQKPYYHGTCYVDCYSDPEPPSFNRSCTVKCSQSK